MDVYDILAAGDTYHDKKTGKEKRRYTTAGVAFDPKDGGSGMNGEVHKGIALTGPFIIRLRKEKTAAGATAADYGLEDDGSDCLQ